MHPNHPFKICVSALLMLGSAAAVAADHVSQPVAPVRPVTDTYFGTPVVDPYRWMESLDTPEVQDYMKKQADYTRVALDAIPGRAAMLKRIHELSNLTLRRGNFERRGDRYFYQVTEPGASVPKLFYRDGLKAEEHLLIDPGLLSAGTKTHFALDFYVPSQDGKFVAYGISSGGSEASVLHVIEVSSGRVLPESIDRAEDDSALAWRADNKSFYYLRYRPLTPDLPPEERLYNAHTFLHTLGVNPDGTGDQVVFGRGVSKTLDVPEGQGTYLVLGAKSPWAIAVANHNMDDNPNTLFIAPLSKVSGANTPWRKLATPEDGITHFAISGETLYFLSQKSTPRGQLMATPLAHPDLAHARVVLPQSSRVMTNFALSSDGIYVDERDGAISRIELVSYDGNKVERLALPFEGTVYGPSTDPLASGALFNLQGWVRPAQMLAYDASSKEISNTGLIPPVSIDTSPFESKEVMVTSYDGTQVPLSIVYKKGLVQDGSHPTILEGYGSYGLSEDSYFSADSLAWLERGGVFATAHIRGGGELGEEWHTGGQKLTKINTVFDFIACGQYLVDQNYTTTKKLGGIGGSAGGVTAGGALTWRPDLFAVILDLVGMSDALRMETEPNGPPNVSEFGSTKTEAGFHGLYAMSAYQHLHAGVAYPAVLYHTGAHDPRVAPWQMLKMTARTQADTSSGKPVLLSVDYDAGHGIGSSSDQRDNLQADLFSFALWQMGDPEFQPAK